MKNKVSFGVTATVLILVGVSLSGCAGDYAPVQIGNNVYTLATATRMSTYHDASEHCKKMGLVMKVLSERKVDKKNGIQLYDTNIDYKCLNPNSREYTRYTKYEVASDVSIKVDNKVKYE